MKAKIMIAVLLCLLVLPIAFAAFPGNWWGKVYIKGEQAPNGTPINAYINDNLVATTKVGNKLGSGYYELFIEGKAGDTIIFKIGSIEAGTANFTDGSHAQLDLNLTEPACGDTLCNGDETCSTCPEDCGACPPSGGGRGPSGGGGGGGISCTPVWQCTAWTKCSQAETQTRACTDKNNCGTTTGKPVEIQKCNYVPPKTATQEEETEPETISGEPETSPVEATPEKEETEDDTTEGEGVTSITGRFVQVITGGNKWVGIGIILLILIVGLLFYFFVIKKRRKKSKHTKD